MPEKSALQATRHRQSRSTAIQVSDQKAKPDRLSVPRCKAVLRQEPPTKFERDPTALSNTLIFTILRKAKIWKVKNLIIGL